MIALKRVYEPATEEDGTRFLVERLWPRGVRKDALMLDAWLKDVAPSTELRRWFGHDPERFFALLRERRSPLLPSFPPGAYYQLHRATHDVETLRRLRRWAAPVIKGAYAARPGRGTRA